jgi:hypothetical protein
MSVYFGGNYNFVRIQSITAYNFGLSKTALKLGIKFVSCSLFDCLNHLATEEMPSM